MAASELSLEEEVSLDAEDSLDSEEAGWLELLDEDSAGLEELVEELAEEVGLLEEEEELEKRYKEEQKKARTHRLCQIGGAVESVLGDTIEEADIPKLIGFLKRQEENGCYFSRAMGREPKEKKSTEAIRQEDF